MERNIVIIQCMTERKDERHYLFVVRMADGYRYTMLTENSKLYHAILKAEYSGNEELVYTTWIEVATQVLHVNDVYFDTLEIM